MEAQISALRRVRVPAPAALNYQSALFHEDYKAQLRKLRIEIVKRKWHLIECSDNILVLLEGRGTMLLRTHSAVVPCHIVKANGKRLAR